MKTFDNIGIPLQVVFFIVSQLGGFSAFMFIALGILVRHLTDKYFQQENVNELHYAYRQEFRKLKKTHINPHEIGAGEHRDFITAWYRKIPKLPTRSCMKPFRPT